MREDTLTRWQSYVKTKDHGSQDIPISIGFSTEGKIILRYTLSQTVSIFDTFTELEEWLDEYLNRYID